MEVQYNEGLPRVVIDRDKGRMYVDTSGDTSLDLATFYEHYLGEDLDYFRITPEFSEGLHAALALLKGEGKKRPFVKVQTTGPLSFGLTITDEAKRAIYYNAEFCDVIVKGLAMKCRWQIQQFSPYAEQVICFVDEPILSAFGSSTYVSVQRDDVVAKLGEVIEAVHAEGALAGVHCCGNTEWPLLIDAGADIVNFDAFEFGHTIAYYPEQVSKHLEKGGVLAWGVVPTNADRIRANSVDDLILKFTQGVEGLAAKGVDRDLILRQAMLTPSCGTGSLPVPEAEMVFDKLRQTSERIRQTLL
jgi:hypothetical protein